ncbi:N-alpha-acetyltransferase 30 [Borealophlyctis nickersoniae]|nr:N-alpha-acetyltransferase 30 [Borealophlyctis nickersoniae]
MQSTPSSTSDGSEPNNVPPTTSPPSAPDLDIQYVPYESELQLPSIIDLIENDLSEPYSIYTYRYFIHNWPKLCLLAKDKDRCIGVIVGKLDLHNEEMRGYIAMLAVAKDYRKRRIGSSLVRRVLRLMKEQGADGVVLETEHTNTGAISLYENLGFVKDKRLSRYYLNGVDAFR